jgi:hypothetical protein
MAPNWTHLIRFIAEEDGQIHLGQVDAQRFPDVGLAMLKGEKLDAKLIKGSAFDGVVTEKILHVAQVQIHRKPKPNHTFTTQYIPQQAAIQEHGSDLK